MTRDTVDPTATTQPESDTAEQAKTVIGARFELIALLGAGGMGNVYKARDVELDEIVALKVLRPEIAATPGAIERFRREVKLARRVTHPNVARVFDIGEQGGEKILTMELIDGEPLSTLLAREGSLTIKRAVEIARAICEGVGAAHAAGVVHRDLKPDNVMLAKDGRIVVTDFGIARAAMVTDAQRTGGFVGTPAYMAPEQVEGVELDGRADVYAFGAMLYEMLTGTYPWHGESAIAVAAARLIRPPPDPRDIRPDMGTRIAELVLHCLARKPENRPENMSAIVEVLATITTTSSSAPPPRGPALTLASGDKRVAVLPFRNLGPAEHEYIADGLTDDLIDLLSMARGLRVHSQGVVAKYKGVEADARLIGRELDVQVVVEGSIRKGTNFRITARVISVADGLQLWAKRFEGGDADMLALNDEVARAVAEVLTADLGKAPWRAVDAEAVDLYLRARLQYLRNYFPDASPASELFARALERAPDDPRMIAGYAMAQARTTVNDPTRRMARTHAERAVRLAPSLPETHVALGVVLFQSLEVDAMRSFRRALALNANSAETHDFIGRMLDEADGVEAPRHLELAISLEPIIALSRTALARHYALRGDWDRAEDFLTPPTHIDPQTMIPHRARFAMWRRDRRAAEELIKTFEPNNWPLRSTHTALRYMLGEKVPHADLFPLPPYAGPRLQCFYAQRHAEVAGFDEDVPAMLGAIERAAELHLYDAAWLTRCPLIQLAKGEPRFEAARETIAARAAAVRAAYAEP